MTLGRYLILVDRTRAALENVADRVRSRLPIQHQIAGQDCRIFVNLADQLLFLPGRRGVVIGTLFARHGPARAVSAVDRHALDELAGTDLLATLRDRFWGGYVAIDQAGGPLRLIRDPVGAMPCYYKALETGWAIASDADLLVEAGLLSPKVDWAEMPRFLTSKDLPCERSCIEGLRELLAGTCLELGVAAPAPIRFWSPWDYATDESAWDGAEMAQHLRRTVDHCVASWASTAAPALATLSGGLDSSVVVSGLARAKCDFKCATLVTQDRLGDERDYARAMASYVGAELHEARYLHDDVDLGRSVSRHFPKPIGTLHETAYHAAIIRKALGMGAACVFTGNGGDSIFYNSSSVRPLFDHLYSRWADVRTIRTFNNICEVTRSGRMAALREVVRSIPEMRRRYAWRQNFELVTDDVMAMMSMHPPSHRWLDDQPRHRPGKVGHVSHLLKVQNHVEGYLRSYDMPMINPLMSQPIVELALAIPTWRMIEGGRDRAVVRRAYEEFLPPLVRDRRRKGSPSGFAMDVLRRNASQVRARLMEGELVRHGLVNPDKLEASLQQDLGTGHAYVRLLILLDMEAWIDHWRNMGG